MDTEKLILIIEDDQSMKWVLEKSLTKEGHRVVSAADGETGLSLALNSDPDMVILDILLPDMDGLRLLKKLNAQKPNVPVLIITAQNIMKHAVEAMRQGAFDYLPKPFDVPVLLDYVSRGLAQTDGGPTAAAEITPDEADDMLGKTPIMEDLFKAMGRVAATDATVLVFGESGTGKELVAKAIHKFSARVKQPFVAVNSSAIPGELLESVLFGHEKGAFTGATETRRGKFELARGGTLFLDEIGDMPLALQTKILRVLESREFERVGGDRIIKANVRVISATHRDLRQAVRLGEFREDLYYRLNVVSLQVPPLRKRIEDIPLLAEHFLRTFAAESGQKPKRLTKNAMESLMHQTWPGNVRELINTLRRASVLAPGTLIRTGDISFDSAELEVEEGELSFEDVISRRLPDIVSSWCKLEEGDLYDQLLSQLEKPLFEQVMRECRGNQLKASKILGINRNTLRERLRRYGLIKENKRGRKKK